MGAVKKYDLNEITIRLENLKNKFGSYVVENEIKYYSIDKVFNRCGECCMDPDKYWIYHIFESGLTEAEVEHPCEELGYTEYETTETHGAMGITMTLDKYKKPE